MARTTVTHIIDDMDGSKDASEVTFALDGVEYSIDLSKKNRAALAKALKPFIDAGTRIPQRSSRGGGRGRKKASGSRQDLREVRDWAKAQGIDISDRGRVPTAVLDQYDARSN